MSTPGRSLNGTTDLSLRDAVLRIDAEDFDPVLNLAFALSGYPIALVSYIDRDRQRFIARRGVDEIEAPLAHSFCTVVCDTRRPLVVVDAKADPRFAANGFVTERAVRTYVGVPLAMDGETIGALCVLGPVDEGADRLVKALEPLSAIAELVIRQSFVRQSFQEMRHEVEMREARFRQTEASAKVGGFRLDLKDGAIKWSDQVYRNVGLSPDTPLDSATVLACYAPEDQAEMRHRLQAAKNGIAIPTNRVYRILTPAGEERWLHVVSDVEMIDGEARSLFGIVQDVSEQYRTKAALETAALTDDLTGLGNLRRFRTDLQHRLDTETAAFGLLLLDLDGFKIINDAHGHVTGDLVLQDLARKLEDTVGADGAAYRLGGDEFAVLVRTDGRAHRLEATARAILAAVQRPMRAGRISLIPRVSIGGGPIAPGSDADGGYQAADFALYHAKEHVRGGYVEFNAGLRTRMMERIGAIQTLEGALLERRLVAHYQPIVDGRDGTVAGFEALVRLVSPSGAIIAAGAFHEALQDANLSHQVTSVMIESVAAAYGAWDFPGGVRPYVGINVSASDFARGDLPERLFAGFSAHGVDLRNLVLEVTETVFLEGVQHEIGACLQSLRDRGVRVALDDFGTGHASLSHLKTLPVDIIKIDKSFVDTVATDRSSFAIVEAMANLARRLGMRLVAEGVETEDQVRILQELGIDGFQGYLFARPAAQEAFTADRLRGLGRIVSARHGEAGRRAMRREAPGAARAQ